MISGAGRNDQSENQEKKGQFCWNRSAHDRLIQVNRGIECSAFLWDEPREIFISYGRRQEKGSSFGCFLSWRTVRAPLPERVAGRAGVQVRQADPVGDLRRCLPVKEKGGTVVHSASFTDGEPHMAQIIGLLAMSQEAPDCRDVSDINRLRFSFWISITFPSRASTLLFNAVICSGKVANADLVSGVTA